MLTLPDLRLGLRDLLDKRRADLLLSKSGAYHEPMLAEQLTAIDALPPALTGGTPFAVELSKRADMPKGARKEATVLRSVTVGILGRLRSDIGRELKKSASLPKDLEQRIFGYFDTLEAMRDARGGKKGDEPEKTEPEKTEPATPAEPKPV